MSQLVIIIVAFIIALQIFFFVKNVLRMQEYKNIFIEESSWDIAHNPETKFVSGIYGNGNVIFDSIKDSINKYLENNSGSVIDFSLLKDAVDRHCDSVENDINTLTPVPLYCGLAGTMAGVIVGLSSLLITGSISALLSSGSGSSDAAADGVNDLLSGVAWAMLASICGIILTTFASLLFKRYKLQGEYGKNTFLAWLQSRLLPELPSDTSDALNRLVKNLNKFNNTFAENTSSLRGALREVNESYRIQGDIIKAVHDMDVMKMAKANVRVLEELKECTDKLEQFNEYLNDIHGYTDAIHTFTTQFEQEANRLHVLEEIRQYFSRHKAEIAKDAADSDVALRDALRSLRESSESNAKELNSIFVQQAEDFKRILKDEKESFEQVNKDLQAQFSSQIKEIPMIAQKLADVADIPQKIDDMIVRLEKTNDNLYSNFLFSTRETLLQFAKASKENTDVSPGSYVQTPHRTSRIVIVCAILIAIACTANTIHNIWFNEKESQIPVEIQQYNGNNYLLTSDSTSTDTTIVDSVKYSNKGR
ncbi:MAG: apolipoprotein A1/A4/E family protein [Prevotella sp.]|nr:apolipoprotein A1/A4/E family protein [Prevotella sp.]